MVGKKKEKRERERKVSFRSLWPEKAHILASSVSRGEGSGDKWILRCFLSSSTPFIYIRVFFRVVMEKRLALDSLDTSSFEK
jgi:hypothetical protein